MLANLHWKLSSLLRTPTSHQGLIFSGTPPRISTLQPNPCMSKLFDIIFFFYFFWFSPVASAAAEIPDLLYSPSPALSPWAFIWQLQDISSLVSLTSPYCSKDKTISSFTPFTSTTLFLFWTAFLAEVPDLWLYPKRYFKFVYNM